MSSTGILSKGITLAYRNGSNWTVIPDLMEIPEIGGTAEKVEVTTLADANKRYINGIADYGDLAFKFLFDNSGANSSYRLMHGFETNTTAQTYKLEFADGTNAGTNFVFGGFCSTKIDSVGVSAPLTFTASIALSTNIATNNPTA